MFCRSVVRCAVKPYARFMIEKSKIAALKGKSFVQRSRAISKMWARLSVAEKAAIKVRGARTPKKVRRVVKRRPSAYAKFVQANFFKFKGTASNRIRACAQAWQAAKAAANPAASKKQLVKRNRGKK